MVYHGWSIPTTLLIYTILYYYVDFVNLKLSFIHEVTIDSEYSVDDSILLRNYSESVQLYPILVCTSFTMTDRFDLSSGSRSPRDHGFDKGDGVSCNTLIS